MIAVGSAMVIVLVGAFAIRPWLSWVSNDVFGIGVALAMPALAWALLKVLYRPSGSPSFRYHSPKRNRTPDDVDPDRAARIREIKEASARMHEEYQQFKRARVAELASDPDPVRRRYAALIARGESWTDAQIAYQEDKALTGTCEHLAPVEREMRRVGIVTRRLTTPWKELATLPKIHAKCHLHEADLRYRMRLAPSVHYGEGYQPERHEHDNPWASLSCTQCGSSIDLIHPDTGPRDIVWFPSEPH